MDHDARDREIYFKLQALDNEGQGMYTFGHSALIFNHFSHLISVFQVQYEQAKSQQT
jgi:hypothetical protein